MDVNHCIYWWNRHGIEASLFWFTSLSELYSRNVAVTSRLSTNGCQWLNDLKKQKKNPKEKPWPFKGSQFNVLVVYWALWQLTRTRLWTKSHILKCYVLSFIMDYFSECYVTTNRQLFVSLWWSFEDTDTQLAFAKIWNILPFLK